MTQTLRIALAQINTRVADFQGNCDKIISYSRQAEAHADIILFPELAISGYSPKDLLSYPHFVAREQQQVERLVGQLPPNLAVVFGHVRAEEGRLYNSLSVVLAGRVVHQQDKTLRPSYDIFTEQRHFHSAAQRSVFRYRGVRIGLAICEDMAYQQHQWRPDYHLDPLAELCSQQAELLLVIAASPLQLDHTPEGLFSKDSIRARLLRSYGRSACYLNLVGGNDELIFDGQSFALNAKGELLLQLDAFSEKLGYIELPIECEPLGQRQRCPAQQSIEGGALFGPRQQRPSLSASQYYLQLQQALQLGLRDYVHKSGFERVHLGLSGGVDSALVATLAVQALGADKVRLFALPSRHNAASSYQDAQTLAQNLGVKLESMSIEPLFVQYLDTLAPLFAKRDPDLTEENLQARIRGTLMMAVANKFGSLLLLTGNKSEFATGYATLYGDMCGALAVIGDLLKTEVFALCHYINLMAQGPLIPTQILTKEPSAELRFQQKDSDSLPPYPLLDQLLYAYLIENRSPAEIKVAGLSSQEIQRIISLVDRQEYKRYQAAPLLKIAATSFGSGRILPLARKLD